MPGARVIAYDFHDLNDKKARYWRDVGTIDAYYEANMDLVAVIPEFNLYDQRWPIRTRPVAATAGEVRVRAGRPADGRGHRFDRFAAGASFRAGAWSAACCRRACASTAIAKWRTRSCCTGVQVGRYSRLRNAIIDAEVSIPESSVIGYDLEADRAKGTRSPRAEWWWWRADSSQ